MLNLIHAKSGVYHRFDAVKDSTELASINTQAGSAATSAKVWVIQFVLPGSGEPNFVKLDRTSEAEVDGATVFQAVGDPTGKGRWLADSDSDTAAQSADVWPHVDPALL